jgi:hypothetical protein
MINDKQFFITSTLDIEFIKPIKTFFLIPTVMLMPAASASPLPSGTTPAAHAHAAAAAAAAAAAMNSATSTSPTSTVSVMQPGPNVIKLFTAVIYKLS